MKVIILAQGSQRRLPNLPHPKQMLRLALGGETILQRTLRQLRHYGVNNPWVVAAGELAEYAHNLGANTLTLPEPGNASTVGCHLALQKITQPSGPTLILLGDVCYSWRCLDLVIGIIRRRDTCFIGSSNLSVSTGELWAVGWPIEDEPNLMDALKVALRDHRPPVNVPYQPGQLRNWLWAYTRRDNPPSTQWTMASWPHAGFVICDDYTRDFDTPKDLDELEPTARAAIADDKSRGARTR